MQESAIQFLIPVSGLAVNVLCQVLSVRLIRDIGILKSVFAGFCAGFIAIACAEFTLIPGIANSGSDRLFITAANMVTYCALAYCYFHFLNLGITARRIRILRELHSSRDGLTLEELRTRYNAGDMIGKRLERLMGSGQIILRDNRYYTGKPVMLWMSRAVVALKWIILGKTSEFD